MPNKTTPYREALLESLGDPETAAAYLTAAMSDSPEMFRKALRNVAQARQMAKVARDAGVTRESLYRATSEIGNPTLDTLYPVLAAVGITMKFEATESRIASAVPDWGAVASGGRVKRYVATAIVPLRTHPGQVGVGTPIYVASSQRAGSSNLENFFYTGALAGSTFPIDNANLVENGVLLQQISNSPASEPELPAFLSNLLLARNNGRDQSSTIGN